MKYQLFSHGERAAPGMLVQSEWYDLKALAMLARQPALSGVTSMEALLEDWTENHVLLSEIAKAVAADPVSFAGARIALTDLQLRTPLTRPGAIFGAGANYRDHVEAMGRAFNMKLSVDPKADGIPPWHFLKSGRSNVVGHGQSVAYPANTERLDWEAELAVVIGRRARAVSVSTALDYVAGYMCANDLSARDHLVRATVDPSSPFRFDWIGHKCFEGSCPLGPVLTPAEFVADPENLDIKLWVNGEIMQDSNTSNHLYGVAENIAHLSALMDLYPGDIILTGTPAGVGMERGVFLKRGDRLEVSIEGLGILETALT